MSTPSQQMMLSEMVLTTAAKPPIRFADSIEIKWSDPSPISASSMADDLMRIMNEYDTRAIRYYSDAWATRHMAGMEPPRDRAIIDSFPID